MAKKRKDTPDDGHPLSRRGFLFGTGITAVAAVGLDGCRPAAMGTAHHAEVLGPGAVSATLRVNGIEHRLRVEPRATLAQVLRDDLGMTGTKVGCDRGSCSACTVWLDGVTVNACTTFALDAVGRAVTTIEGLEIGGALDPVQDAFIAYDALQCGFCTPGMIMSCAALLKRTSAPTLDDVKAATSGNLCRCGTYPKVFEATLAAAELRRKGRAGA